MIPNSAAEHAVVSHISSLLALHRCPSCQTLALFTFCGVQSFPAHVARKSGLPQSLRLYTCAHCGTTVSDHSLLPSPTE